MVLIDNGATGRSGGATTVRLNASSNHPFERKTERLTDRWTELAGPYHRSCVDAIHNIQDHSIMNAEGNPLRQTTYIIHNSIHSQSTNMYYICTQRRIGGLFGDIILAKRRRRSIVRADVDGYACHAFRDDHYHVHGCPRLSNGGGPPIPPWMNSQ